MTILANDINTAFHSHLTTTCQRIYNRNPSGVCSESQPGETDVNISCFLNKANLTCYFQLKCTLPEGFPHLAHRSTTGASLRCTGLYAKSQSSLLYAYWNSRSLQIDALFVCCTCANEGKQLNSTGEIILCIHRLYKELRVFG